MPLMDGHLTSESNCSRELFSSSFKLDGRFQTRGSANIRTVTVNPPKEINEHGGRPPEETKSHSLRGTWDGVICVFSGNKPQLEVWMDSRFLYRKVKTVSVLPAGKIVGMHRALEHLPRHCENSRLM